MKMRFTARQRLGVFAHASRVQSEQETYDMAVKRDVELKALREGLFQAQEAAKHMTKQFDVLRRDLALLQAVAKAAAQLCDNAEEYECDGLGLFAQHGWWEPLHEALDALNESETRRDPEFEQDAARYRWLRGRISGDAFRKIGVIYSSGGHGIDVAIDAAMREGK